MRYACLILNAFLITFSLLAEGTRQLAPNGAISIAGNTTTDIAALHIGNPDFDNFADYSNTDPNNRLYIHIQDPEQECIYLGFSLGHRNVTSPNPTQVGYEYRIKDPDGNVVFGPVIVNPADANIHNWSEGYNGPMQLNGDDGYDAVVVSSSDLASEGWSGRGDYYVEFRTLSGASDFLIDFWDITVVHCAGSSPEPRDGRVWSYNWSIFAINDFGFPNRPFNGAFFVCAPDPDNPDAAFITRIDFNESGFMPAAFNIAFNSFGVQNTGNVMEDRRSVELLNATQAEYAVFLNDPVDICATAEVGEIELLGISRCDPDAFCIKFSASKEGQIDLLLDFDGNDQIYTPGSADVMVAVNVAEDQINVPTCIDWNGEDGLGNPLPVDVSTEIPVVISYAQGIYHFPVYDAELMINGFSVEAVRPAADQPRLFYDDSNISVPSGSGEPSMQLTGCVLPCHRWSNFTNNSIPGFGNLHTINSWWFSQLIIRQHVFTMPAALSCLVAGPATICEGSTAILALETTASPEGVGLPDIASILWSGPGIIGSSQGKTIEVDRPGMYSVDILWLTALGDTCQSSCTIELAELPASSASIDILIVQGDSVEINDEIFTEGGQYLQVLTAANGCDSLLTINITALQTVVSFDLDGCRSYIDDGSNMDYSEFIPSYPQPLSCAQAEASILFRDNPESNRHSCTPGINDSPAMCISSADTCAFVPGSDQALVFDVTLTPAEDTAVALTGLSYYERAPEMFDWIDGSEGVNNYPTRYAVRVLKNGTEIFKLEDQPTVLDWHEVTLDFLGIPAFIISQATTFRFELLGYCLIGNGAPVAAWDLDEIRVQASCASPDDSEGIIAGTIRTPGMMAMPGVEVRLNGPEARTDHTDGNGQYAFEHNPLGASYQLSAVRDVNVLEGVSTLDLIRIQKHLLGTHPFSSPFQYLAADINRNNSISASDLLELRRVLLGLQEGFSQNTSWRFGDAHQDIVISDPWNWKESITIDDLSEDATQRDFIGVKVGDVTGDTWSGSGRLATARPVSLNMRLTRIQPDQVRVDFRSSDFESMAGFQIAMRFEGGDILSVENGLLKLDDSYAIYQPEDVLRISWAAIQTVSAGPDDLLFSVVVATNRHDKVSVRPAAAHLKAQAYLNGMIHGLELSASPLVEEDGHDPQLRVRPNPFNRVCNVAFSLATSGQVVCVVRDVSGRILYRSTGAYPAGQSSIHLDRNALGLYRGVAICTLTSASWSSTASLVIID